ncbi:MAG: TylF/MycF/NovP-related O-methyltransferase [Azonexus sp.]|nr:TylF/MycF/NovP-related O-methyltransferase [Azonexus sp.]
MNKPTLSEARREYLDLMQAWLTGSLWHDGTCAPFAAPDYDAARRECGLDWPAEALTMIGVKRLANLRQLTQAIIATKVPGDLIETGVWRGGACIMMRAILFAYGVTDKRVWVADSFAGLPPGDPEKYPLDAGSDFHTYEQLVIPLNEVQENFGTLGFLDEQTVFLPGWFRDTLPGAPIDRLALIRLDGDMYESTLDALDALYPRLSTGGFVIVDDYHVVPACQAAVFDYCARHGIRPEICEIDGVGVFWRKDATTDGDQPAEIEGVGAEDDALAERILLAMISLRKMALERMARVIALRDERIVFCQQTMSDLKEDIAQRDAHIAQRDAHIAQRDVELAAIRASMSWRITRPLRGLKQLARAIMPGGK